MQSITPPLTTASAREVWESAMREAGRHFLTPGYGGCAICWSRQMRCDEGARLARAEASAWELKVRAEMGTP